MCFLTLRVKLSFTKKLLWFLFEETKISVQGSVMFKTPLNIQKETTTAMKAKGYICQRSGLYI